MMPSREELLQSIRSDMKLSKNFFMRIYGYEITWPGFADQALDKLEQAGCSKARQYYDSFVGEYEKKHDEQMKDAAAWYMGELKKQQGKEEGEELRIQKRMLQILKRKL